MDEDIVSYLNVETFALQFVDNIIKDASIAVENITEKEVEPPTKFKQAKCANVTWPTISEFTEEIGSERILKYSNMWRSVDVWLFCVMLVSGTSDSCSSYYLYEVKWSIPTRAYPIPQAVASVFFTIEVSRISPKNSPVKVTYVFEGSRFVHTPGKITYHENWLQDIITSKMQMYRMFTF